MPKTTRHRALLSLGSNIAPEINLPAAVGLLGQWGEVMEKSQVWESAPVGFADQNNFLNAAVLLITELDAEQVVAELIPSVERALNRTRDPLNKNGPRTIDVDLSLFDDGCFTVSGATGRQKTIPDPDILTRAFVAIPLAEIAGDQVHPATQQTLAEIGAGFSQEARAAMKLRADIRL